MVAVSVQAWYTTALDVEEVLSGVVESISQAKEMQPRCVVSVFLFRTSLLTPELPGPRSENGTSTGWTQVEKQKGRGCGGFRVPSRGRKMFLFSVLQWAGRGKGRTIQRGRSRPLPRVRVHMRLGRGTAIWATYWCAVLAAAHQTAANLNLYGGMAVAWDAEACCICKLRHPGRLQMEGQVLLGR